MPTFRWKLLSVLAALTSAAPAHSAPQPPDWFGPPCTTVPEIATQRVAGELLLSVRREPADPGSDEVVLRTGDGTLWVQEPALRGWNLIPPTLARDFRDTRWYALRAIDGVRYRYDACSLTLWLDTSAALPLVRYVTETAPRPPPDVASPGAFLNLEPQYTHALGAPAMSGLAHLGLFNAWGYGGTSALQNGNRPVRLETNWVIDDLDNLERLTLGDGISRSSTFGRFVPAVDHWIAYSLMHFALQLPAFV